MCGPCSKIDNSSPVSTYSQSLPQASANNDGNSTSSSDCCCIYGNSCKSKLNGENAVWWVTLFNKINQGSNEVFWFRACKNNECLSKIGNSCLKMVNKRDYCIECVDIPIEERLVSRIYESHEDLLLWDKYTAGAKIHNCFDYTYDGPRGPKTLYRFFREIP